MENQYKKLLYTAIKATVLAGKEILFQYKNGFDTVTKEDGSPVTTADLKAHEILTSELNSTNIPVLSEEGDKFTHEFRQNNAYWCIDPIDGTKDFVGKTDEFCVSVGLISENTSKVGVLYAPALDLLYFAAEGIGSFKFSGNIKDLDKLLNDSDFEQKVLEQSKELSSNKLPDKYTFLSSRYFRDNKTKIYIEQLKQKHPDLNLITMGSAVKIGVISEKKASEFTRFTTVNFWDVAGGHAIAKYAGLKVINPETNQELDYTDENMKVHGYSIKW